MTTRRRLAVLAALGWLAADHAQAQAAAKTLKFWNLTAETITGLELAPPGTNQWSANLCLSDPDHAVDPDERLSLKGVAPGSYDVRVTDAKKRRCLFRTLPVKAEGAYALSIAEDQMKGCAAP